MARKFILPAALVIALGAALTANDRGAGHGPDSVAATVNGEKIASRQVESMLAPSGAAPGDGERTAGQAEALERIIDQELLAQEARKAGLERDPRVAHAIESSRRQILANAWLERVASAGGSEIRSEVGRFYQDNPALFRQRRVYRVLEVTAVAPQEMVAEMRKAAATAGNLYDVAAWLEARHVPFNVSTASRPAEQIPLHILPRVAGMREGQIAVFPMPRGASIVQLLRSSAMPMSEVQAAPVIERYLLNRKRVGVALVEVGRLRAGASIEYLGDYRALRAGPPVAPARARETTAVLPPPGPGHTVSN
jgi:EpsD family peptidyl-prolyl cis-trans isomerase